MPHRFAVIAALCLGLLLSSPLAGAGETIEVKHNLGATSVPVNPKRVVTFDLSILDSIDSLGIQGIEFAVPKQTMPPYLAKYKGADVVDAGGMKEPNLERIYEFQPDVIFISARQTDYYDKLSEIAPTVCANVDYNDFLPSFERNMTMLGDIFQVRDAARKQTGAVLAKAAAVAAKAEKSDKTALIIMVNDGAISVYGPGSRFGVIHDVLKVKPADQGIKVSLHGQSVDFEYLARINPDILFVINRNMAIGTNGKSSVLDNDLVRNTKAGKDGGIVNLDSAVWYLSGAGLESLGIMLDEIDQALGGDSAPQPVNISVIYYSDTGNTKVMAETIVDGAQRVDGVEARAFSFGDIDAEYVRGSKCVIFGTPTHMADMAPAVKLWFVESAKQYGLAGKIGGVYATANYYHGGAELAMQGMITQMLVSGMLVHSGGGAYGRPIIHLGPAAFGGRLEESEELFLTYGERMAMKTVEIFR